MNLSFHKKWMPAALARLHHRTVRRGRALAISAIGASGVLGFASRAMAQAAAAAGGVPSGGIGAQLNLMSGEAVNAGGTAFSAGSYLAAAICFFFGVWALWQSRQPQNRETGYIGRGLAGLVLCGLFASAGVWIGKASVSASGGNATITDAPAMVTFGTGATAG